MTVEVANFLHQLDAGYPPGSDPRREGANHIRLIKSALRATFPNFSGAMTASSANLSFVGTTLPASDYSVKPASTAFVADAIAAASITPASETPPFVFQAMGII